MQINYYCLPIKIYFNKISRFLKILCWQGCEETAVSHIADGKAKSFKRYGGRPSLGKKSYVVIL